jgi:hypothetical protein
MGRGYIIIRTYENPCSHAKTIQNGRANLSRTLECFAIPTKPILCAFLTDLRWIEGDVLMNLVNQIQSTFPSTSLGRLYRICL